MLRLLFFVVPFAVVYWLGLQLKFSLALAGGIAAIIAALISVSLSVIFLSRPRAQAAQSIVDWRNRDRTADDIAEDAALDEDGAGAAAEPVEVEQAEPAVEPDAGDPGQTDASESPRA